ncbi:MAG: lactate utilization protein [Candidatus Competibacteraceae bacterium]|nr:lactate utilization protein [Candidatus Competibacteraceae bacterium]
MSEGKRQILETLRRNLKRGELSGEQKAELERRLMEHPRSIVPARGQLPHSQQVELFIKMAEEAAAEVQRVVAFEEVPRAIASYIEAEGLPREVVMAPHEALRALAWDSTQPPLKIEQRRAENGDKVTITPAFAGIAETGTLMLLSGPHSPTTLNLLPDVHIVVLEAVKIVGCYEEAWQKLRDRGGQIPRTVNMITGPSRSADIEQKLQLGAHGPIRLHIVLVGD